MMRKKKSNGKSVQILLPIKDSQRIETDSTSEKKVINSGKKQKKVEKIEITSSESIKSTNKKREVKKEINPEQVKPGLVLKLEKFR